MAFVWTTGDVNRFPRGKQVASYLGIDSAGVQFGREAEIGFDQQAGESVHADVAGGRSADCGAV